MRPVSYPEHPVFFKRIGKKRFPVQPGQVRAERASDQRILLRRHLQAVRVKNGLQKRLEGNRFAAQRQDLIFYLRDSPDVAPREGFNLSGNGRVRRHKMCGVHGLDRLQRL